MDVTTNINKVDPATTPVVNTVITPVVTPVVTPAIKPTVESYKQTNETNYNGKIYKIVIFVIILAVLILAFYFGIIHKKEDNTDTNTNQVQISPPTQTTDKVISTTSASNNVESATVVDLTKPTDGYYTQYINEGVCMSKDTNTAITCGSGLQKQVCKYIPSTNGGSDSLLGSQPLIKYVECNLAKCPDPIDGSYTPYVNNGSCVKSETDNTTITCGSGKQKQVRQYNPAKFGGKDIPSKDQTLTSWGICKLDDCVKSDGRYSPYVNSGVCVKSETDNTPITCGSGKQKQVRQYIPAEYGGQDILSTEQTLTNWDICNLDACPIPVDAMCSDWIDDPNGCVCNANGVYQMTQTRIYTPPLYGGKDNISCKNNTTKMIACNSNETTYTPPFGSTPNARCPSNSIFVTYPPVNDALCTPLKGTNRSQILTAYYTYPVGNKKHNDYFDKGFNSDDIEKIKNLKKDQTITLLNNVDNLDITIKRLSDSIPEQYILTKKAKCKNVSYRTQDDLEKLWKAKTGCPSTLVSSLSNLGKTLLDLQNIENGSDIEAIFNNYSISGLLSGNLENNFATCYGTNYMTINRTHTHTISNEIIKGVIIPTILPRGIRIDNVSGNALVLKNYSYELWFDIEGSLILVDVNNNKNLWKLTTKKGRYLTMQYGGNLIIENVANETLWSTNTSGDYNCLYLGTGFLFIKDRNDKSINYKKLLYPENYTNNKYPDINYIQPNTIFDNSNFDQLILKNGRFVVIFYIDGKIKLISLSDNKDLFIWDSGTSCVFLSMQSDGNLVTYTKDFGAIKNTATVNPGNGLYLTSNGYLILKNINQGRGIDKTALIYPSSYPDKIYTNTTIDSSIFSIVVLQNGDFKLVMQVDGNLVLYQNNDPRWSSGTSGKATLLDIQGDGNVVLKGPNDYNNYYNTYGHDRAYLYLTDRGFLRIREGDNVVATFYPNMEQFLKDDSSFQKDIRQYCIDNYLSKDFYSAAPYTIYSDMRGFVWKATWGDLNQPSIGDKDIFKDTYSQYSQFNGIKKNQSDGGWNVKQIDLTNINGFIEGDNDSILKWTAYNWLGYSDTVNYTNDGQMREFRNRYKNNNNILPIQFDYELPLPNYNTDRDKKTIKYTNRIPGYKLISATDEGIPQKVLIIRRDKDDVYNGAYILFTQIADRKAFAADVYDNNKFIRQKIKSTDVIKNCYNTF